MLFLGVVVVLVDVRVVIAAAVIDVITVYTSAGVDVVMLSLLMST